MVRPAFTRRFSRSQDGSALVEFTIVMMVLFLLVFGFVDFGYALYQWNAASKAVQVGARLSAISSPVTNELEEAEGAIPGGPVTTYSYSCDGATATCTNGAAFDVARFDRIVQGSDAGTDNACDAPISVENPRQGMCDIFWAIERANVVIDYAHSGLGFATRPGGDVPTIRVRLQGLTFDFFFLDGLIDGFVGQITIPSMASTITGEDLRTCWPSC